MTFILQLTVRIALVAAAAIALTACAGLQRPASRARPARPSQRPRRKPAGVASYFEVLDLMAPGDAVRQSTELASTLTQAQQNPTSSNRLRYAIALGAAGHRNAATRSKPGGSSPNCSRASTT